MPRGRALSLLALLLVRRGDAVHLDRVRRRAVGGEGPQHARNAVQVVASRLRAALGDDLVRSEAGGYAVRLAAGRARRRPLRAARCGSGARSSRAASRGRRRRRCGEALELWRGPALADVAEERFAQPEIARLEDLRLSCLSERIEADLALRPARRGRRGARGARPRSIRCASACAAS